MCRGRSAPRRTRGAGRRPRPGAALPARARQGDRAERGLRLGEERADRLARGHGLPGLEHRGARCRRQRGRREGRRRGDGIPERRRRNGPGDDAKGHGDGAAADSRAGPLAESGAAGGDAKGHEADADRERSAPVAHRDHRGVRRARRAGPHQRFAAQGSQRLHLLRSARLGRCRGLGGRDAPQHRAAGRAPGEGTHGEPLARGAEAARRRRRRGAEFGLPCGPQGVLRRHGRRVLSAGRGRTGARPGEAVKRASCCILLLACAAPALAQYPSKPVRIVVPYSAGGGTDIVARAVGQKLSDKWHQSVIVDNRVGANGIIGADAVAKAPADGYTLLMATPAEVSTNPHLYPNIPYNAERDLAPITLIAVTPLVVAVYPGVPAKSIAELTTLAKEKPGTMGFATPGTGSAQHLTGEMLMMLSGMKLVHVPYKGAGQSIPDVIGGQVPIGIYGVLTISQHVKAGRLRMLAVTTLKRSSAYPDLPTLTESGISGLDTSLWFGLIAPAATPKPVIGRIHDDVVAALKLPDLRERIASQGGDVVGNTPEEFAAFIAAESAKYAEAIKRASVKLD